jgi:crotonobetainyl-CoA:carnitine CoA-transferase CaiB-like acyl-CoA transferase
MLTINSPIWVDGCDKKRPQLPPALGEHSDEILRSAGYSDADIKQLRAGGAVG